MQHTLNKRTHVRNVRAGRGQFSGLEHDGFRIHRNPDNTYVFLEGIPDNDSKSILSKADVGAFKRCLARHGIPALIYARY